ncbi:MFS transporter [Exiguobacterium oxidotolerans]|uniref:MFS transporter n=1 Tax=Exiguobacterium oxidotolerans TaxID=223958 RepID=A0A653I8B4_9BACL|nr:MFS transporter [Exiguobacterium oxidotolerans]VWX35090.1 MFS transporter [Exiguobacterium oxidotolerans]
MNRLFHRHYVTTLVVNLLLFITFYLLNASLPLLAAQQFNVSQSSLGWVVTAFILATVCSRPLIGHWLDRYELKRMLLLSATFFMIVSCLYLIVLPLESFSLLLIIRVLHGFSFGMISSSLSLSVTTLIPPPRQGEGMGYFVLSMNLASVLGPVIGLTLIAHDALVWYFVTIALLAICSFSFIWRLPLTSSHVTSSAPFRLRQSLFLSSPVLLLATVLAGIAISSTSAFISLYADAMGHVTYASYFYGLAALGMVAIRPFAGKRFDRRGPASVLVPSYALYAVGFLVLGLFPTLPGLLFAALIIGIGSASIFPGLQTVMLTYAAPAQKGKAISTFFLAYDSGFGIGAFLLSGIAAKVGYSNMFLMCSLVVVSSGLLYGYFRRSTSLSTDQNIAS